MKILILTYSWPPLNAISTHRPYWWAKTWSEAGCDVTVIAAEIHPELGAHDLDLSIPDSIKVHRVPYGVYMRSASPNTAVPSKLTLIESLIKRVRIWSRPIQGKLGTIVSYGDIWEKRVQKLATALHASTQFDVVVSTFGPRACHTVANTLKMHDRSLVWIADYRDMWGWSHHITSHRRRRALQKLERETVGRNADSITTASPLWSALLERELGIPSKVILNGYDTPWEVVKSNIIHRRISAPRPLKIVYTGTIYPARQDPAPLFRAINNLRLRHAVDEGAIVVEFYGKKLEGLERVARDHNALSYTHIRGYLSRATTLQVQREAHLLLLLESPEPDAHGVIPGKTYEYIASGTPILSLGSSPESELAKLMKRCNVGYVLGNDSNKIESLLESLVTQRLSPPTPNLDEVRKLSREYQSKLMLDHINQIWSEHKLPANTPCGGGSVPEE